MECHQAFKLALAQVRVDPVSPHHNLVRALERIRDAAAAGAQVVLLPEAMPLGWMAADTVTQADAVPDGAVCRAFRDAAAQYGIYVCSGLVERHGASVFNAAVLIDPAGAVLLHHRKLNELDIAQDLYARGDRLAVADSPWGRIGLMICADAFAEGEVITRTLATMGARLVLSPCAWAVPPAHDQRREPYGALWRRCYGTVARDHRLWIAGASSVGPITAGPWHGHQCIGCSMVVDDTGAVAMEVPYGPDADALLLVDVVIAPG